MAGAIQEKWSLTYVTEIAQGVFVYQELIDLFKTGITRPVEAREKNLRQLKRMILQMEGEILAALRTDLGKCEFEGRATETGFVVQEINHALDHLYEWTRTQEQNVPLMAQPAAARVEATPKGAVLVMAPWNYPFHLALAPVVTALAAGNTVALKPSELAPHVSRVISALIHKAFPDGVVRCYEGGVDVAKQLLAEPFDHFFFTGSTAVGRLVAIAAAEHLSTVTLELGGKSPCIVDKSANLKHAARRIAWGKSLNAGQTCVAPDYILVHASVHDELVALIKKEWQSFYGDDPAHSPDYGRIVNDQHFERLLKILASGVGTIHGGRSDQTSRYLEPTMITGVTIEHLAMKDEIFGPILPVLTWNSEAEIMKVIGRNPNPLAFYVFATDRRFIDRMLANHQFGGGCVNHIAYHLACPDLPFGGVHASGVGQYHGKYGFDAFTHYRGILTASPRLDLRLKYPPYGKRSKLLPWLYR